jgi:hypothetical protein
MNAFRDLQNEDIRTKGSVISTAEALRAFLQYRSEVISLRRAIERGEITPNDIKDYVHELFRSFSTGIKFAYEIDLAAISMALETFPGPFAEEYLKDLSRLQIRELPLAPRVARLCLARRRKVVSGVTVRTNVISIPPFDQDQSFKNPAEFRISAGNDCPPTERLAS